MVKNPLVIAAMFFTMIAAAQQEHCTTPDESIADPNSITKCAVDETDGSKKTLSIEVSTRKRVVRKNKEAVSSIGMNSNNKIADIKKNTLLVGKLELEDNSATIEKVPFNIVEEIPLFPKCNNVPLIKQAKCFTDQMSKHVISNFKYPESAINQGIGGRVLVQFTISATGQVQDILLRGPQNGEVLEKEAKRIINRLPTFTPGKHNGKAVKVKYGVPITFQLPEGVTRTNTGKRARTTKVAKAPVRKATKTTVAKAKAITDYVKFSQVHSIPQFKACSKASDMQKLNCFNERMISHIQRNFNYPEAAAQQNIQGKVWVRFIIDKNGNVVNIKSKGPQNGTLLEKEAERMVSRLPKFSPGQHDGKVANVEYYIPINFQLKE
ncbi:energy transducer TonB [uncultured Tenacibaculum sp.]|uniref:energy transducer TonB n=1 Tax=uncultured Tenacibaculum sp. TaxID=174713 RepID=UPI0026259CBB|nr:energy transducer TonB [uncultured Tenacibaculum sp.]